MKVPVNARVNLRALAKCALYIHEQGRTPTSRSELINIIVESVSETLQLKNGNIRTVEDAERVLHELGITYKPGSEGHRRIHMALSLEADEGGEILPDHSAADDDGTFDKASLDDAIRKAQEELQKGK